MKIRMKLNKWLSFVDDDNAVQEIVELVKESGQDPDEVTVKRSTLINTPMQEGDDVVQIISTRDMDRDSEILMPKGADLSQFKKAPQVLLGHNHGELPIGKATKIEKNGKDVRAVVQFAPTERGQEAKELVKGGFLKTCSVGFIPLEIVDKGSPEFASLSKKLEKTWDEFEGVKDSVRRIIKRWMLLEFSYVSVPSNINALTVAVAKGDISLSDEWMKDLGIEKAEAEAPEKKEEEKKDAPGSDDKPEEEEKQDKPERFIKQVREIEVVEEKQPRYIEIVDEQQEKSIADEVKEIVDIDVLGAV